MHWVNLIIVGCLYIGLPMVWGMLRSASRERSNLILSVTLPPQARQDPEVQELCARFRRRLDRMCLVLTAALVPALFLPWMSLVCLYSFVWLLFLVLPYWLFGRANGELKALKRCRGWQTAGAGQTVAEMPPARPPRRLSRTWFWPPLVLSVLPVLSVFLDDWDPAWQVVLGATAFTGLLMTGLSLVFYPLVYRQRLDALDGDTTLTAALTRVRRYNWTKFWLLCSWLTTGYSLAVWLCWGNMAWYIIWNIVYALALIWASLQTEFAARRAQRRLTEGRTRPPEVDEDDRWIWGLFYCDPHDGHTFVNQRIGMGMSMNLAKPLGKGMMGVSLVLLAAMPLLGAWLVVEEFSPLRLGLQSQTVVAQQAFTTYRVPVAELEEVRLLEELPPASRIAGTSMDRLLKGSFSMEGEKAIFCLDPQDPPFLLLKTEEKTYVFGGDATRDLAGELE